MIGKVIPFARLGEPCERDQAQHQGDSAGWKIRHHGTFRLLPRELNAPVLGAPVVRVVAGDRHGLPVAHRLETGFEVRVAVLARGRWLTVLETRADVQATAAVRVVGGQLLLTVDDVVPGAVDVTWSELAPHAHLEALAPAAVKAVVPLLFSQPLAFDIDLEATLAQVLALPVSAEVVGLEPHGDWLVLGVSLGPKKGAP